MTGVEDAFDVTPMRIRKARAHAFFYVSTTTTMADLGCAIDELMPRLLAARDAASVQPEGPITFRYLTEGDSGVFTLCVGCAVADGTTPGGDALVCRLDERRCATVVLAGSIRHIGEAAAVLERAMQEEGLRGASDYREVYALYEGDASPANVTVLQHVLAD